MAKPFKEQIDFRGPNEDNFDNIFQRRNIFQESKRKERPANPYCYQFNKVDNATCIFKICLEPLKSLFFLTFTASNF